MLKRAYQFYVSPNMFYCYNLAKRTWYKAYISFVGVSGNFVSADFGKITSYKNRKA